MMLIKLALFGPKMYGMVLIANGFWGKLIVK